MKIAYIKIRFLFVLGIVPLLLFTSCSKYNPNNLPSVSPNDFAGKIEGFDSSEQVQPASLVAYWSFDGNENEAISGISPTSKLNDSYIDNGVRGKAVKLNKGYLYYATQIEALGASLHSFTILEWVQIVNSGSGTSNTQIFQLARPGFLTGNINFVLETSDYPASDTSDLIVHPTYFDGGGTQDNLNANWSPDLPNGAPYTSPTIGSNKWTQVGVTYDSASNVIQVWGNGKRIGTTSYQQRGTAYYSPTVPNEVIMGGNYNNIPDKVIAGATPDFTAMVGGIDEIRIYNVALGAADIKALYELGVAGK